MMARIMISCAGKDAGDAAIIDFPDSIAPEIGVAILFTEIGMARCSHTMKATLSDGRIYCCDCGKILGMVKL
jgi:hypothetical protein